MVLSMAIYRSLRERLYFIVGTIKYTYKYTYKIHYSYIRYYHFIVANITIVYL